MELEAAPFRLLDYRFAVATDSESVRALIDRVLGHLRDGADPGGVPVYSLSLDDDDRLTLRIDDILVVDRAEPSIVVGHMLWRLTKETVASSRAVLIHSGAVARHGRAILLPGPSGSGKTTLTAGLVRAGFSYLSDELAALEGGLVHPAPRPLVFKNDTFGLLNALSDAPPLNQPEPLGNIVPAQPDAIRNDAIGRSSRVSTIIAPRYVPDVPTRLEETSRAAGLRTLAENAFNLQSLGQEAFRTIADIVRESRFFELQTGDLREAVAACVEAFESGPAGN